MPSQTAQYTCPSCGRPTDLTQYGPEPSLCTECQRAYGLSGELAAPVSPTEPVGPRPDQPVWGLPSAIFVWLVALVSLGAAATASVVVYMVFASMRGMKLPAGEQMFDDPKVVLVSVLSSGVAHAITLAVAYFVVTDGLRLPFLQSIGWGWTPRMGFRHVVLLAIVLQTLSIVVAQAVDTPEETPFSKILQTSQMVRIAVAVFAVGTAPFVEELVYRGVLYPAVERSLGRWAAIILVSAAFLVPHIPQYNGEIAIMIPLATLSVALTMLRAFTGSLLPSFALHFLFNGITVSMIFLAGAAGAK